MNTTPDQSPAPLRRWQSDRFPLSEVAAEIAHLTWHPLPATAPALPGLAIQAAISELAIRNVRRVAWGGLIAERYDLLGIESSYTNGTARIYLVDTGTQLHVVASDVWPLVEPEGAPPESGPEVEAPE